MLILIIWIGLTAGEQGKQYEWTMLGIGRDLRMLEVEDSSE